MVSASLRRLRQSAHGHHCSDRFSTVTTISYPPPRRKLTTIKALSESHGLSSIPSIYTFPKQTYHEPVSDTKEPIPTIDFSLLTSSHPDQMSKTIRELGKACRDCGFFMVTNHGVPERMMKAIIEVCREFFELPEKEKRGIGGKHVLDPIRVRNQFQ
ncbi:hypothetical protein J1N35_043157 [Gossypium stocksii]|uniref:Non-haem dioxygenase N-terminal domain-containing protein n=1 Tax=Gossypium stocksii TaxID=47602 RepID=A0A9D3ZF48_9ROSI|nr:hypothetical protein J1N35_043157 [Gossypium stocksii]